MQIRVGHMHLRHRVAQGSGDSTGVVAAFNRIARVPLAEACEQAFADAIDDDAAVYVVRRIVTRMAVSRHALAQETPLAREWARSISASTVRAIAASNDTVVRFANQADFVASFLVEFVRGVAWNRWYFGAFRVYRGLHESAAIAAILDDNREFLWDIFGFLIQRGALDDLLARLGAGGRRAIWSGVVEAARRVHSAHSIRIFVWSAFSIIDLLQAWSGVRPGEADLLPRYVELRAPRPDWTKVGSLADTVADVVHFLLFEGHVRITPEIGSNLQTIAPQLASQFDWLDSARLIERLNAFLVPRPAAEPARAGTSRPFSISREQSRLLELLLNLVRRGKCTLEPGDSTGHSNFLRLAGALAREAGAGALSIVYSWLERIIALALEAAGDNRLQQALFSAVNATESAPAAANVRLASVAQGGAAAILLALELSQRAQPAEKSGPTAIESRCAGVFLVVRAVEDLRLPSALTRCSLPYEPVLAGLATEWMGELAWDGSVLDPAVELWAGIQAGNGAEVLAEAAALSLECLIEYLEQTIAGQRLIELPARDDRRPLAYAAELLLRSWARWIPGLGHSSVPYLLSNFVRRGGAILADAGVIEVQLDPAPLDAILGLAGYLSDTQPVSWLGNRPVRFRGGRE
jgi:hypothetical protein